MAILTEDVTIAPGLRKKLEPGRMSGLVYPVSIVEGYLEACMGLRDWDQPLSDRWKPQDLLPLGVGDRRAHADAWNGA